MKNCIRRSLLFATAFIALNSSAALAEPVQPNTVAKGWVWANQPSSALSVPYVPPTEWQHNERYDMLPAYPWRDYAPSALNSVTRTGVGAYRVTFPHFAVSGGTAHVTAYGGNHTCKIRSWSPSGGDMNVNVSCFTPGGSPVDGRFSALFYKDGLKSTIYGNGYLWADQPSTTGCYTPSPFYQFNSRGGTNTICRISLGLYDVRFPNMEKHTFEPDKGGTFQVTAYGTGPERCKVRSWFESGDTMTARVGCSHAGVAADTRFTASFARAPGDLAMSVAEDTQEGYYVWADAAPNPNLYYQVNSYGTSDATLEGPSTGLPVGQYRVHLPGVDPVYSTAQVTSYGSGDAYCTVAGWGAAAGGGTTVTVQCFSNAGPANAQFNLLYLTRQIILY